MSINDLGKDEDFIMMMHVLYNDLKRPNRKIKKLPPGSEFALRDINYYMQMCNDDIQDVMKTTPDKYKSRTLKAFPGVTDLYYLYRDKSRCLELFHQLTKHLFDHHSNEKCNICEMKPP